MNNEEVLEAGRESQVQLMVKNDVSKLPLWFGVPANMMEGMLTKLLPHVGANNMASI